MTQLLSLTDLDDQTLSETYAAPRHPWLRLNFVSTLDGAAQGPDRLSGSINNAADDRVFAALRRLADVVIVGAGTVRAEAYQPNPKPLVVVTRTGRVPASLLAGELGQVYLATCAQAPGLADSRALLGEDNVLVLGEQEPDLRRMCTVLAERGFGDLLCEGGPHLARDLLAEGVVDELCCTFVPRLVGGDYLRITHGEPIDAGLTLGGLIEADGTLLGRWFVQR